MDNKSIEKLESDLWEAVNLLRQGSKTDIPAVLYACIGLIVP